MIERKVEAHDFILVVLPYYPERREALLVRQLRVPALTVAGVETMLEARAGWLERDKPAACATLTRNEA